jgi:hypothetical protein
MRLSEEQLNELRGGLVLATSDTIAVTKSNLLALLDEVRERREEREYFLELIESYQNEQLSDDTLDDALADAIISGDDDDDIDDEFDEDDDLCGGLVPVGGDDGPDSDLSTFAQLTMGLSV